MSDAPRNNRYPTRKRPVHTLPLDRDNRSTLIFLTACTKERQRVLACEAVHKQLRAAWLDADHWLVGRYLIMPDHIHLFCAPGTIPPHSLEAWVRYWKSQLTKRLRMGEGNLWQTDFWDVQLRERESYALKWEYVRNNPVRAGLVSDPLAWEYQGELNDLRWRE